MGFIKNLYTDYSDGFAIIEMIGEWNDTLYNDIMILKREFIDLLVDEGITKFILIGENILNFHSSDDSYYEEWFEDIEDGWIALINFRDHVLEEFASENIDQYFITGGDLDDLPWRTLNPSQLFTKVEKTVTKRLSI